ncbi:MAG: 2-C-methyl-D-erythritol 2,4-cyclodiphosphate synthase [Oscillospiraceae bacterium]|jgi:2-C-methyl-D-erythritol 2,4-cyclodiphosphate synthase|nr:2-C-methyl-D-erythritol 2,4-cyclodiphosphate synthase [Oscillospiraceae bacterium]
MRIGHGYDVHRFAESRPLILGGVRVPHTKGLLGHSDADVLCHAIMDALLGAAGLDDIGQLFPDSDPAYKDADSIELLRIVCQKVDSPIANVDSTIIAQVPKLAPYIPQMKQTLSSVLRCPVNVKATTEEYLGFTGREEGIAAHAVALVGRV